MENNQKLQKYVARCYSAVHGAGILQLKIIYSKWQKHDAISATDNFYFCKCYLIIVKFCEQSKYVEF